MPEEKKSYYVRALDTDPHSLFPRIRHLGRRGEWIATSPSSRAGIQWESRGAAIDALFEARNPGDGVKIEVVERIINSEVCASFTSHSRIEPILAPTEETG